MAFCEGFVAVDRAKKMCQDDVAEFISDSSRKGRMYQCFLKEQKRPEGEILLGRFLLRALRSVRSKLIGVDSYLVYYIMKGVS